MSTTTIGWICLAAGVTGLALPSIVDCVSRIFGKSKD